MAQTPGKETKRASSKLDSALSKTRSAVKSGNGEQFFTEHVIAVALDQPWATRVVRTALSPSYVVLETSPVTGKTNRKSDDFPFSYPRLLLSSRKLTRNQRNEVAGDESVKSSGDQEFDEFDLSAALLLDALEEKLQAQEAQADVLLKRLSV